MGKNHLIVIAIIIHWPTPVNLGQVSSPLTFQATLQWSFSSLMKPGVWATLQWSFSSLMKPGVCMPYQVLQPYAFYMQTIYAPLHFFFLYVPHGDYTITTCCFILSLLHAHLIARLLPCSSSCSLSAMTPCTCICTCHWCPYKENPYTKLHGSSATVTTSHIGVLFSYMVHQSWFQYWD